MIKVVVRYNAGLIRRKIRGLLRLVCRRREKEKHRPDPSEYSAIDAKGTFVPVQAEAYFLLLNRYVDEGDNVLDVGHGLGYGMNILAINAGAVSGVEIDKKVYAYCQDTLVGRNPKLVDLKMYDGSHLQFPDASFDIVSCVDVLEHVEDYHGLVDEMLRVSRKGVFISTPNRRLEHTEPDGTPRNRWHLREWSFEELHEILQQHGEMDWNFLNGTNEGPFTWSKALVDSTSALSPFVYRSSQ